MYDMPVVIMRNPRMLHPTEVDWLDLVRFVMVVDDIHMPCRYSGEADQFPADHILVATVDRVGEEPILGIGEEMIKKGCPWDILQFNGPCYALESV
jgi:hypothetical protein